MGQHTLTNKTATGGLANPGGQANYDQVKEWYEQKGKPWPDTNTASGVYFTGTPSVTFTSTAASPSTSYAATSFMPTSTKQ